MSRDTEGPLVRWLGRWIVRGRPLSVLVKLTLVAFVGIWRWHKASRESRRASGRRELPADYEVLPREGLTGPDGTSTGPDG